MQFNKQTIDELIKQLNSDAKEGLNENEVRLALQKFGKNELKDANTRSIYRILFGQFTSPLVIILVVASGASFYLKQARDGIILLIIVVINALIGFYQEWKSENILASIKKLVVDKCTVIRQGKTIEIFAQDLVPGDIVLLSEGVGIPADIRLIESNEFATNEFVLTGESLPSAKDHLFVADKITTIAEVKNCVFMGTTVARGEAKGIVYATGSQSEIGQISTSSQKIKSSDAPIQIEIKDVATKLTIATLIIGVFLFVVRIWFNDPINYGLTTQSMSHLFLPLA